MKDKTTVTAVLVALIASVVINVVQFSKGSSNAVQYQMLQQQNQKLQFIMYDLEDELAYCRSEFEQCRQ